ncbi:ferredoxin family protein [Thermocladium modestius]|uniref:Ferredoxin family protein n=1 Tax=Thermocladium modestius TaxID=62609 RepID=A0A830GWU4_9CREN|nr:ferredoxin family protein [Thermocladium modestius]GGP21934.1 ferredoxin family protein [Thermocladium modestius]
MSMERKIPIEERLNSNAWDVDERPHIRIKDPDQCRKCDSKPCLYLCPARCYTPGGNGAVLFSHEGCVECGTCRVVCPNDAIEWNYPRSGYGVQFRFG